ncbi:hypothetical protein [Desulfosarcina cetonica]|uniref:hypothetical protein n=1 Tax=Desulfosarcina cetonica TaxID=90730 RepID=UPI0012EE7E0E|nr:hypothetical protein [Desulfosarcina cetonica]
MNPLSRTTALIVCLLALALPLHADDTEIYGTQSADIEPNILIIFDTSGSMSTKDVPSEYYSGDTVYSGSYVADAVYQKSWNGRRGTTYSILVSDIANVTCTSIKEELESNGYASKAALTSSGTCGGSKKDLYLGNYLNYDASGYGTLSTRIAVAQTVITNIIQNTENVRFGLMRFNDNDGNSDENGGRVIKAIDSITDNDTYRQELIDAVGGLTADGRTPLAESLAEAGLYFAGMQSWFNSNYQHYTDDVLTDSDTYTSPMQYRCQKNYIILMTDGAPTADNHTYLANKAYINGDTIGDYDKDGNSGDSTGVAASDYLDDVAAYLYQNDCNPSLGTGDSAYEKQNIITYTIGFQTDQELLEDTAANGGGEYYVANSISGLTDAFESIISSIQETNAIYTSPVVPLSSMNQVYAGNYIYVGFFKPQSSGRWAGNVKKYGLDDEGAIIDANDAAATDDDGNIKDNAQSYWSNQIDGPDVTKGGLGELLMDNADRQLFTYLGKSSALTDGSNAFSSDNDDLTASLLGVSTTTEREAVIDGVIGTDREWIMGDVIHSEPLVQTFDEETYIFVGTNGGLLHAFRDSDGSEAWAFTPPDQLSRLQQLSDSTSDHDYFMDGAPTLVDHNDQKILFFGERRGGYNYYALDITDPEKPIYLYDVEQDLLTGVDTDGDGTSDGSDAALGQSWSSSSEQVIKTSDTTSETVLLMAGGYDTNQDLESPVSTDTAGRAVFTIDVTDGSVSALNFNAANFSDMKNCITDAWGSTPTAMATPTGSMPAIWAG